MLAAVPPSDLSMPTEVARLLVTAEEESRLSPGGDGRDAVVSEMRRSVLVHPPGPLRDAARPVVDRLFEGRRIERVLEGVLAEIVNREPPCSPEESTPGLLAGVTCDIRSAVTAIGSDIDAVMARLWHALPMAERKHRIAALRHRKREWRRQCREKSDFAVSLRAGWCVTLADALLERRQEMDPAACQAPGAAGEEPGSETRPTVPSR